MAKHIQTDATAAGSEAMIVRGGWLRTSQDAAAVSLDAERRLIGRASHCAVVLPDRTVSAVHAEVQAMPQGVRLVDLGSRNGTFIGSTRIVEAFLTQECEFRCGDSVLRFAPTPPVEVALGQEARFGRLVGATAEMRALFAKLRRYAETDLPFVVSGETGTGKELVARAIHEASARRDKPFVAFNCAAVPESLMDAELFGHERGAFTGADRAREGLFAAADGGTLFLDEIGEASPVMQAKLLRVLQEGEIRPVGSTKARKVNVRTICATHVDLEKAINAGRFREDLYFRLARVHVVVPPLCARLADIPLLVEQILSDLGRSEVSVSPATIALLQTRNWSGNVRELRNLIETSLVGSDGGALDVQDSLPLLRGRSLPPLETLRYDDAQREFKRRYYTALHAASRGNVSEIARRAGRQRFAVRTALREVGIDLPGEDDEGERRG